MSLNWSWHRKHGEMDVMYLDRKYTVNLYESNAVLCAIYEFVDKDGREMYNVYSFWVDKEHAKRSLGLAKGCDNIMTDIVEVRLNASSKYSKTIGDLLLKAMKEKQWDIKLSYYYEEGVE